MLVAVVAGAYAFWPREDRVRVTGEFQRAVGLFPGSDVRVLGVQVGEVTEVTPKGDSVLVEFEFDRKHSVPADAKAAVVAPSLVSDRYVQLFPAYQGGPKMGDGARIGLDRTAVPVELDRISQSLDDLLARARPSGRQRGGRVLAAARDRGRQPRGPGPGDPRQQPRPLPRPRDPLRWPQRPVRHREEPAVLHLDAGHERPAGAPAQQGPRHRVHPARRERDDLSAALKNLAIALNEVSTFVRDNRAGVKTNVAQLASVTSTVAKQRDALAETLTNAPVAVSNLQNAYNPRTGTLDTRSNMEQFDDPALLLCSLVTGPTGTGNTDLCKNIDGRSPLQAACRAPA